MSRERPIRFTPLRVAVPATTANLGPGFDVLGLALSLYNRFEVEPADQVSVTAAGEGADRLPRGPENLFYRAFAALFAACDQAVPPVRISMHNAVPVGSGLGSSATAIAGGIAAARCVLAELQQAPEPQVCLDVATRLEGHPDNVAPALFGGFGAAGVSVAGRRRRGGHPPGSRPGPGCEANWLPLPTPPELACAVAVPGFELSTRRARAVLPQRVSRGDAIFNVSRAVFLVGALTGGRWDLLGWAMDDRLHQPYRQPLVPGMAAVLAAATAAGAAGAALSGAGPSIIALCRDPEPELPIAQAVAAAMAGAFGREGITCRTFACRPSLHGALTASESPTGSLGPER